MLFLECGSISETTGCLTIQVRAEIAARYEVRNSFALVPRQWGACKGRRETLCLETVGGCLAKLMTTGSVNHKRSRWRLFTSGLAEKLETVLKVFMHSLHSQTPSIIAAFLFRLLPRFL